MRHLQRSKSSTTMRKAGPLGGSGGGGGSSGGTGGNSGAAMARRALMELGTLQLLEKVAGHFFFQVAVLVNTKIEVQFGSCCCACWASREVGTLQLLEKVGGARLLGILLCVFCCRYGVWYSGVGVGIVLVLTGLEGT